MRLIDSNGRLFGRINLFDAAAVLAFIAMGALATIGYGLLHTPSPPVITTVTPTTLTAGGGLHLDVRGDNLLPYLRLYVQKTGDATTVMHETTTRSDAYQLVNYARAALLIESPVLAEVRLPADLLPGTYDLVLHNESKVLFVRRAAFTIVAVDAPKWADVSATVRFVGGAQVLAQVREGDADVVRRAEGPARIISLRPRGVGDADASVLECVVSVPVVKGATGWAYGTQVVKAGARFSFETERYLVQGTIQTIGPPSDQAGSAR